MENILLCSKFKFETKIWIKFEKQPRIKNYNRLFLLSIRRILASRYFNVKA